MTTESAERHTGPRPPRAPGIDNTLSLLREGYRFIGRRCQNLGSDIFETRLLFQPVYCASGRDAAEFFYGGERFGRKGALPPGVLHLLQDLGSVQQLEGTGHHHRKAMFLKILGPEEVGALTRQVELEWRNRLPRWQAAETVNLFDEMRLILTRAAVIWAGLTLDEEDEKRRMHELSEMIEATGSFGVRKLRALRLRRHCEDWARQVIRDIRSARLTVDADAPAAIIAHYDEDGGFHLPLDSAVVELLNLLRPTVAISHFIVFAAKALHEHPGLRDRVAGGGESELQSFAEEVRRTAPFFPFIGGRALRDLEWRGMHFPKGSWVLLDLYGTDHDPANWEEPDEFRPERFLQRDKGPYSLVPQGAGDMQTAHRCPGEPATQAVLKTAVRILSELSYELPEQDLSVDLSHIPALPKSGVILSNVRPRFG